MLVFAPRKPTLGVVALYLILSSVFGFVVVVFVATVQVVSYDPCSIAAYCLFLAIWVGLLLLFLSRAFLWTETVIAPDGITSCIKMAGRACRRRFTPRSVIQSVGMEYTVVGGHGTSRWEGFLIVNIDGRRPPRRIDMGSISHAEANCVLDRIATIMDVPRVASPE